MLVYLEAGNHYFLSMASELYASRFRCLQVIDSRTFGYIPLTNIVGRVIYAASSRRDHGPVMNNPASVEADQAIIEGEVDVEKLCQS